MLWGWQSTGIHPEESPPLASRSESADGWGSSMQFNMGVWLLGGVLDLISCPGSDSYIVPGKVPLKADSWLRSKLLHPLLFPLVSSFLASWRPCAPSHLTSSTFLQAQHG